MILITTHTNADFDSLAGMVAASRLYPGATLCFPGAAESQLRRYIADHSAELPPMASLKGLDRDSVERLVCVDVSDRARLGPLAALLDRRPPIPVDLYDHHPSTCELSGEVHLLAEAGACTSLMVEELHARGIEVPPGEASLYLLGIYEDTGFLTFPTTRPVDFKAVLKCLEWGGDLSMVQRRLRHGMTESQMRLLTELVANLEAVPVGGVTVHLTTLSSLEYIPDLSILVQEVLNLEDLDALFLLAYLESRVHIIARSRTEKVDVCRVLDVFGGGGHPSAAAATLKGKTLEEARRLLVDEITLRHPLGCKASDIFTTKFRSVEAKTTVQEAFREMNRHRVNALPVFKEGALVGVVTRQEVDGALQHGMPASPVGNLVVTAPPLLPPDTPAEEVRRLMLERSWRVALFGESPTKVVGLLSRMSLFKSLYRLDQRPTPRRSGGHPSRAEVLHLLRAAFTEAEAEDLKALGALGAEMGTNCLLVGGAVRDLLLQKPVKDVDFVVEGSAPELARAWAARRGGRVKEHAAFGTAVWSRPEGGRWDFATARAEYYEAPAALPTVAHAALYQDLYRRDFTLNTLALHLDPERFGEILDLFGGVRDLKSGRIRVLHGLSFVEDPTRAFRAVRFSVRLGFTLPPETANLIHAALSQGVFRHLSPKRVMAELQELVEGPSAVEGIQALGSHGLLPVIWPDLKITPKVRERLYRLQQALDFFEVHFGDEPLDRLCLFIMVLFDRKPADTLKALLARFPFSRKSRELMEGYRSMVWRLLRETGGGRVTAGRIYSQLHDQPAEAVVYLLARLDDPARQALVRDFLTRHRYARLEIGGEDLLAAGVPRSAAVAKGLLAAKIAMVDGKAPTREAQLEAALEALSDESSTES